MPGVSHVRPSNLRPRLAVNCAWKGPRWAERKKMSKPTCLPMHGGWTRIKERLPAGDRLVSLGPKDRTGGRLSDWAFRIIIPVIIAVITVHGVVRNNLN